MKFAAMVFLIFATSCQTTWQKHGFEDAEVESWKNQGYTGDDTVALKIWKDSGFDASETKAWLGERHPSDTARFREAKKWRLSGFRQSSASEWIERKFTAEEAKSWVNNSKFFSDPMSADLWRSKGIQPGEAACWHAGGYSSTDAKEWIDLGFGSKTFDLKNFGFINHELGLTEFVKSEVIPAAGRNNCESAVSIANGLEKKLKIDRNAYRQWLNEKFLLADVLRLNSWAQAGFKPSEISPWLQSKIDANKAFAYKRYGISPEVAKDWYSIGILPEQHETILDWTSAGLNAQDYKLWASLGLGSGVVKQLKSKGITPDKAPEFLSRMNNFFARKFGVSEVEGADNASSEDSDERVRVLSDGSIISDEIFRYLVAYIFDDNSFFAKTYPDLEELINEADTDYQKEKIEKTLESDKRVAARKSEFVEFIKQRRICHSSPFEKKYASEKWELHGSGGRTNVVGILPHNNEHERFMSWSLENLELMPLRLSVANYGDSTCKPTKILGIPLSKCSVPVNLPKDKFDEFDKGDLSVIWCFKTPLKHVQIKSPEGYISTHTDFIVGTEVELVVADKGGKIIFKK